ncbi:MAG: pyridoxal phosphate-dependent class II aminotransferase [Bacteroidales bacterium]|nr:pyridoxal phosphate-dependent class II aminotransferase [Bacteroidales bacterium]
MIYGHGDDLWRYAGKVKHNFSTNIHSAFDHRDLMKAIAASVDAVTAYPEPEPLAVERAVAELHDALPEHVMVANGATEAIYLIAAEFPSCKSAIVVPTFREYQDAAILHGHEVCYVGSLDDIPADADLVWLCNPNNPTGEVVEKSVLLRVIAENRDKILIVDQAYSDYTLLPVLTTADALEAGNVILLGSLTKRFAVPGLRIGYAVGCRELMDRIKRRRMPWSVNGLSMAAALYLLGNISDYKIDSALLHSEALRLSAALSECGIKVRPTDCNFILCELPQGSAWQLKEYLIQEAGILIRDASNFEGLDERHFRVAAQTPEENDMLIENIKRWIDKERT